MAGSARPRDHACHDLSGLLGKAGLLADQVKETAASPPPPFHCLSLCVFSTALPCVCFHWRSLCVSSTLPFLVCVFPLPFHCFSTALHCLTLPCTALHCPERRAALPRRVSQMQGPAGMEPMPDNYILQVGSGHAPENKPAHRMGKSRPGSPHD